MLLSLRTLKDSLKHQKQKQEEEKIKQHKQERMAKLFQNTTGFEVTLDLCMEWEKAAELEREILLRN